MTTVVGVTTVAGPIMEVVVMTMEEDVVEVVDTEGVEVAMMTEEVVEMASMKEGEE